MSDLLNELVADDEFESALHSAEFEAAAGFDENEPRDEKGQWTTGSPGMKEFVGDGSLPRPKILMGDHPGTPRMIGDYLASHGQEFKAQPLPEGYTRGELGMCYMNATHALWQHGQEDDLDYAEGIAYPVGKPGEIGILHAWLVDKAGNVIDPTLPDPEKVTYFGVRYPRRDYLRYIVKTKIYGVLGGLNKDGERVLKEGTLEWKGRARRQKS